jgi:hypothetical protein
MDLIRCRRCKVSQVPSQYPTSQLRTYKRKNGKEKVPHHVCKDCRKERKLISQYNLTLREFTAMQAEQGGMCRMGCGKVGSNVDHCHATGRVRGLLCSNCNTGLGLFNDNPELLRLAARYVEVEGKIYSNTFN